MLANTLKMSTIPLEKIRNIGFVAHIDAGKTTTTERTLYYTGKIYKVGEVDEGTTTMDWMPQEQERGITITSACITIKWEDCTINIIDTPGHVDFTVEVERSLKVLDGAIVIFCGVGGVESQTETVWRQADKYHVPRIAFVNKMDRVGSDFFSVLDSMRSRLGANVAAINLPFGLESDFQGVIDLIEEKLVVYKDSLGTQIDIRDIPEDYLDKTKVFRQKLLEALAEADGEIMESFLHDQPLTKEKIKQAMRRATLDLRFVPVLCGTALRNKGIQSLLDAICDFLPSPKDVHNIKGVDLETGEYEEREVDERAPFCSLCFKVVSDPYVGTLNYIRIYSGRLRVGDYVYNATKKVKERVAKLIKMHANRQEAINEASTGDIVAAVGLKETMTGDTLCNMEAPMLIEAIRFPVPVIFQAIEPKSKVDQERLFSSLKKLSDEDPTLKLSYNSDTGQTILAGMGQLHLEVIIDRVSRDFGVEAKVGKPQVAYREAITKKVNSTGKFIQQTGGRGQYGHVVISMEPQEVSGTGNTFEERLRGSAVPREYIPAIKEGIELASKSGGIVGFPVIDVKVTLLDGSSHEVDSSELAFQMAGTIAFNEGFKKAKPIILEPIMDMEIVLPEEYLGVVIGDLNSRRAKIISIAQRVNLKVVRCYVPLAEAFDYATTLRSLSQGRATYTMEPLHYQEVPSNIKDRLVGTVSVDAARFV